MSSPGYRHLLANNQDFRRLWLGDVSSFLGDWFNLIALYTAVQALTSSSVAIALVMVVKTLPSFLIAPFSGPLVDRYDRRKLLVAMDLLRALGAVGLAVCHLAGSLVGLYVAAFAMVLCTGIAFPSKKAAVPMLVPGEQISTANALSGGTWSVMLAVGAAMGGAATQYFGVTASFVIDAATYLVSATLFWRLPSLVPPSHGDRKATTFTEGVRYLRRTPYIMAVTSLKPFMSFANGAMVLIPLYGTIAYDGHSGALFVGLLYAARGAGAAVGSFLVRVFIGDSLQAMRRFMLISFALIFGSLSYLAHADHFWQACVGYFGSALGSGSIWVFSGTLLQIEADPAYHGRIFSLEFGLTTLILAISAFCVGSIHEWGVTLSEVTFGCAFLTLPPLAFWLATLAWQARREAAASSP